jgi:MFS family permease
LQQRDFRWLFVSMLGQMAAIQMQILMRGWVAFELTQSFAAIGTVGLASAVPMFTLSMFGGVLADRVSRKSILLFGHALNLGFAALTGLLLLVDLLRLEHLIAIALVQGTVQALSIPAGQAIIPDVAGKERLMNAVSLSAAGMSLMRMMAPAVAAFLIVLFGPGWAYISIAFFYGFAFAALLPLPIQFAVTQKVPTNPGIASGFRELADGFRYIRAQRIIFWVLVLNFATAILAMPYMLILPGYVREIFDGGASELGLLAGVSGAGSLVASLIIASLSGRRRGLLLILNSVLLGLSLFAFAAATPFWIALGIMFVVGAWTAGRQALAMVIIQAQVDDAYRGRVMSIFMTQISMVLFGGFIVGMLAELLGVQVALASLGIALVIFTLGIAIAVPELRRFQ